MIAVGTMRSAVCGSWSMGVFFIHPSQEVLGAK